MNLVLLNDLFKFISVDALSLVITENYCLSSFLCLSVFFLDKLFDTVAIDMELFFIAKLSVSFVARYH
jgi:hypothetical protein